ncbi:hypothetical protein GCM10010140_57980 [Streptosporangium pseudovulgare]|uniref:Uncharacterized protein n=1 Tax=Streptosporangium pseudovulgare TaxID=35765 RepID=A0ABQ2R9W3_9ACTN|nr:hypothetical protein GCM10010140_57980 [Streptosporangium pseudovulgare]
MPSLGSVSGALPPAPIACGVRRSRRHTGRGRLHDNATARSPARQGAMPAQPSADADRSHRRRPTEARPAAGLPGAHDDALIGHASHQVIGTGVRDGRT